MIEDRILTRKVEKWCGETKTWRTEYERVEVQIRWPGDDESYRLSWKLEHRNPVPSYYTCNGSPNGCERGRFGQCEYCDRKLEAYRTQNTNTGA
jgi:hypothetical protein